MKLHRLPVISAVSTLFQNPLALLGGLLLCLSPALSPGQSVTFAGTQTSVPTGGFPATFGMAVDERGDVFFPDIFDHAVMEALAVNGSIPANPTVLNLGSGFDYPYDVAVDGSGNVFVADLGNGYLTGAVKEILAASGYTTVNTLGSGFSGPYGVAVDGHGNVFVGDTEDNAVKEMLAVNGSIPVNPTILTLGSGFSEPWGVAVDGDGNVFVADSGNNAVKEILAAGGYTTVKTLAGGFSSPVDVAVDGSGNVFVADYYNLAVKDIIASSGYTTVNTLATDEYGPDGVAVDRSGSNVFFTDSNSFLRELQRTSVNFGSVNICPAGQTTPAPCSQTLTLNYNVNADATLGTPEVLTGGMTHQDFVRDSGSTCTGAVTAGSTCTVNVTFAPLAAGFRNGAVNLTDGSGNFISTTQLSGFGIAATTGPPVAQLSASYLSFGTIPLGTTKTLPLMVANIGGGTLTVAPSITGHSYTINSAESTCAAGVTPGASCTLVVEFSPTSISATHDDTLTVQTNGGNPTVNLVGAAIGLSVSSAQLKFGTVSSGSTEVLPLTVTNVGLPGTVTVGTTITVADESIKGHSFEVLTTSENTCLAGIAAGQSCTLPVEFAPTMSGDHADLLTLTPSAGGGATTVWLVGTTP